MKNFQGQTPYGKFWKIACSGQYENARNKKYKPNCVHINLIYLSL